MFVHHVKTAPKTLQPTSSILVQFGVAAQTQAD